MGYTHFWYRPLEIPKPTWTLLREDVAKLIRACPVKIALDAERPNNPPLVSEKLIAFNGPGGEGHEPFWIPRIHTVRPGERAKADGLWFAFCKTEKKPYDFLVGACLIVLKFHLGTGVRVQSDGSDEDWCQGANPELKLPGAKTYCQSVLGYGMEYEIVKGLGLVPKPFQTSRSVANA